MRTSCIRHPAKEPMIIIRKWQLDFCRQDRIAAALLSFFEYWHNIKLEQSYSSTRMNDIAQAHGESRIQYEGLWQFHTEQDLENGTLIFKRTAINAAIKKLETLGVLTIGRNPNPKFKFDRTRWFLFNPDPINQWLDKRESTEYRSAESDESSPKNDGRQNENDAPSHDNDEPPNESDAAITEITSETTPEVTPKQQQPDPAPQPPPAQPPESGRRSRRLTDPVFGEVCAAYESEIGTFTAMSAEELESLYDEHGKEWVIDAIRVAVTQNARRLSYVKSVLANWLSLIHI